MPEGFAYRGNQSLSLPQKKMHMMCRILLVAVFVAAAPNAESFTGESSQPPGATLSIAKNVSPTLEQETGGSSAQKGLSLLESIERVLEKNFTVRLQREQIEESQGALRESSGAFDTTLSLSASAAKTRTDLGATDAATYGVDDYETDSTSFSASASKQFSNSISSTLTASTAMEENVTFGTEPKYSSNLNLSLLFPLLRGRGNVSVGAAENYAQVNYEISDLNYKHSVSQQIYNAVSAYWSYHAARKAHDIYAEAKKRAGRMLADMQTLVEADEKPASELENLKAFVAQKSAAYASSSQRLLQAKHGMGLVMGIPFDEIINLPEPVDVFPPLVELVPYDPELLRALIETSRKARADYVAAEKRVDAIKVLVDAAIVNMKSQLDFQIDLSYNGVLEGDSKSNYYDTHWKDPAGPSVMGTFSYTIPFGNNTRKGAMYKRQSQYVQAVISRDESLRQIEVGISENYSALINAVEQLKSARRSVDAYERSLENERLKLGLGMATVVSLIEIDDRLTSMYLEEIAAYQKYAIALIKLRYESGTIVPAGADAVSLEYKDLTSLPELGTSG